MTDRTLRVFISSSLREFEIERSAVADAIASIPFLEPVLGQEWSLAAGEAETRLRDVQTSAIYIGLFGRFYSEWTKLEYLAALKNPYREKLIYVKECTEIEPRLTVLIEYIRDRHTVAKFQTLTDLVAAISKDIVAAVARVSTALQRLGEPRPVAQAGGGRRSVHEQAWATRQGQLAELLPVGPKHHLTLEDVSAIQNRIEHELPLASRSDSRSASGGKIYDDHVFLSNSIEPAPAAATANVQVRATKEKEASSAVYPNISPSSEHPVQGSTIDISVTLDFERKGQTLGCVHVPEDKAEHRIDVHLLFGAVSRWDTLVFQQPHGTTAPVRFENVPVPVIGKDARNSVPESVLADITVNFYLNNRWCGEGLLTIEILARKNSQPLAAVEQGDIMPWRKFLFVSPHAAPPDLLVRIQLGGTQLKWSLLSPHMSFSDLTNAELESNMGDLPFRFVKSNFEVFSGAELTDEQLDDLDSKCDLIYSASPAGFKKAYWRLFRGSRQAGSGVKLESIQFVTDEPYVPWELMRVWDPNNSNEPPEILGVRHAVGRWMAADSCELRQELVVQKIAVCATSYQGIPNIQPLPWAEEERKYLQTNFATFDVKMIRAAVKTFLETGMAEIVHFSCHGDMSAQQPDDSCLELEDNKIKPGLVGRPETRLGIGRSKPLVFLNACQVGGAGRVLGLVFGWPQAFLRIGSTACIAPLWSVIDENARNIAEDFYKMTLIDSAPKSLGQALQSIRQQWRTKRSLTYLGYVLYGDPMARMTRV
jgi:hypothetical protein